MAKVHVLVAVPFLEKAHLAKIAAVDPGVEVASVMEEIRVELGVTQASVFPVGYVPESRLTPGEASLKLDRILAQADVFFGWRPPRNLTLRAPHLKWLQTIGVGVNHLGGSTGILDSDIMVTNARGINSAAVAEYAMGFVLMLAKNVPRLFSNKAARRWERIPTLELGGRTLGLVGLGAIGSRIASLARAFGMRVLAARRSATQRHRDTEGVDEVFPTSQLPQMLRECDFVVLTVPLTPETRGMIGEAELRQMKPTSYLINVARGPVVRQDVLLRALKEGWIAGAGLDVFEVEPLPPGSEFWDLPNVIVSPHLAGIIEHEATALTELFCENLRRFLNGEPLLNLVDKTRGY